MTVPIAAGGAPFVPGVPQRLFGLPPGTPWDVSRDASRFLVALPTAGADRSPVTVVLNWAANLPR
jgi:hypothetical protein